MANDDNMKYNIRLEYIYKKTAITFDINSFIQILNLQEKKSLIQIIIKKKQLYRLQNS